MNQKESIGIERMAGQQQTPYPLRLAPELRETLEAIAKEKGRSLNAEITLRLEESLKGQADSQADSDLIKLIGAEIRQIVREELKRMNNNE